jgi:hypothetical protein
MQIQNSLAVRQLLPKGPTNFELIFNFFGYSDDFGIENSCWIASRHGQSVKL